MAKNQTAAQLRAAIIALEGKLPELAQTITTAEQLVADAFAEGTDPAQALDAVSRSKTAHAAALRALMDLDVRWFAAASEERSSAEARAKASIDADRQKFDDAIVKALTPLGALIGDEGAIATMIDKLRDMAEEPFWTKQAAIPLPESPRKPAPRDPVDGHPLSVQEQNAAWRPGDGAVWTGPVHVAPAPKEHPGFDWKAAQ